METFVVINRLFTQYSMLLFHPFNFIFPFSNICFNFYFVYSCVICAKAHLPDTVVIGECDLPSACTWNETPV